MNNVHPFVSFLSAHIKVNSEEAEKMVALLKHYSFAKNEVIQKQGEIPRTVSFIIKGAVRSYYMDEKGSEQTVNLIFENQPFVPFDSFAHQTPSGIAIMALEATEAIGVGHAEFFSFLETYPKFEAALLSIMSQYVVLESEHSKLLRINPARDRYEALCKARPELITRVPLKYISSYIGMTLETLSRVRAGKL